VTVLVGLCLGFGAGDSCAADKLSITSQTTVTVTGEMLQGALLVMNRGNVPAYNVKADVTILDKSFRTPAKPIVGVNESASFTFEKRLEGISKGRYPITVLIHFQDAREYSFSSLSCSTFIYGKEVKGDLRASGESLSMGNTGSLVFHLENPGAEPKDVRATLILPREFSSPRPGMDLRMEPAGRKSVSFPVNNLSALQGASYPAFSFFEYDMGDTHHTVVSNAGLKIISGDNWFRKTRWYWAAGWALLLVCLILFGLKKQFTSLRKYA